MLAAIPILTGAIDLAQAWFENRTKVSQAQAEAKARILEKSIDNEAAWENIMATSTQTSWKDEYWTIVLSFPMVLCFVPGAQDFVMRGFEALSQTPEWYQYLLATAIVGAFGLRLTNRLLRR